jgi:predicted RNA-binding protein YlxR (DUF448 family)
VRLALASDGARVILDRDKRIPGRGAYVHLGCARKLERGQIARTLKRAVDGGDVKAIVSELSSLGDNSGHLATRFPRGAAPAIPVRTAPRNSPAKD